MRDDAVLRRALPLGRGLGRIVTLRTGSRLSHFDVQGGQKSGTPDLFC